MRSRRCEVGLIVRLLAVGVGLWATTLAAQSTATPHGFVSTRYGSHTSSVLLFGYTVGKVTPIVALVENPHDEYREEFVGVFRIQPVNRHVALTYGAAATNTTDAWYGQLFFFPSFTTGRVHTDLRLKLYVPAERSAVMQCNLSPGSVTVDLSHRWSAGGVVVWSAQHGERHEVGAGPRLTLHIPKGSISLDGVLGVTNWTSEFRVSFSTTY